VQNCVVSSSSLSLFQGTLDCSWFKVSERSFHSNNGKIAIRDKKVN
jgi:hypothetical protein